MWALHPAPARPFTGHKAASAPLWAPGDRLNEAPESADPVAVSLKQHDVEQLIARLGRENVLTSEADLHVYSTDVGSPPALVDLLVKRKADAVARCHNIDDVETVVRFCRKRHIPMTPRAAATNALGGAVPKRAGVVLDLTCMDRHVDIDEEDMTVTADAGVVIRDLQDKLLEVGLELPCYPTSMNASTIGGFVAMDGHGIHATRAGNIGKHVTEVEGIGMDGGRFKARNRAELEGFLGLGGATGVITRVTIKLVEATKDKPVVVSIKGARALQALITEVTERFQPKHVMFHNPDFFALRNEAMGKKKNPFAGKHVAYICFPEPEYAKIEEQVDRLIERHGGERTDDKTADEEWAGRLFPIRAKRLGPSLVAGEVFVPVDKLRVYLESLYGKTAHPDLSVEGHVTDDGRVYFFIFGLDDERRAAYPLGWGTSARILWNAKRFGGRAYHCGVWLQAQAKSVFGKERYKRLKTIKKNGDRRLLMNPGMCFPYPAPVPEFAFKMAAPGPIPAPSLGFQLAMGDPMLILQDKMAPYRRHKTLGVKAADVAADMARPGYDLAKYSDLIWGCDIPSAQAIPNPGRLPMSQTLRGKMVLAKAYVTGKIADPWTLKPSLDVADPEADEVKALCPEAPELLEVVDSFRRAVQAEGVEMEVKAVEVAKEPEATDDHPEVEEQSTSMSKEEVLAMAKETPEAEKAWVLAADCIVCNGCEAACPTDAAIVTDMARVDRDLCIADGGCFDACPTGAIRPGEEDKSTSAGWPEGSRLAGQFGV